MSSTAHHVVFQFRLPPVLLLHAQPGFWPRAPRGASVNVAGDGRITVTSVDRSEIYARAQVQRVAAAWLRESVRHQAPRAIAATLSAPSCREAPERYAIALDARVSIAKTAEAPLVAGAAPAPGCDEPLLDDVAP